MALHVECPSCGTALRLHESLADLQVRCGHCQTVFVAAKSATFEDVPTVLASEPELHSGKATASLVLGCMGMIAWCLPILGLPVTITGLVLGILGVNSRNRGLAVAGITVNSVGLVLSIGNAILGAYLAATGRHPWVN